MGIALSPLRTVIAALIAFFAASPIITAMAGAAVSISCSGWRSGFSAAPGAGKNLIDHAAARAAIAEITATD